MRRWGQDYCQRRRPGGDSQDTRSPEWESDSNRNRNVAGDEGSAGNGVVRLMEWNRNFAKQAVPCRTRRGSLLINRTQKLHVAGWKSACRWFDSASGHDLIQKLTTFELKFKIYLHKFCVTTCWWVRATQLICVTNWIVLALKMAQFWHTHWQIMAINH